MQLTTCPAQISPMSTLPRSPNDATGAPYLSAAPVAGFDPEFDRAVKDFGRAAAALGIQRPPDEELRDLCRQIADFTSELFRTEFTIKVKNDPELADDLYFVFDVRVTGSLDEFIDRSNHWHLALRRVAGSHSDLFCLSFDIR